MEASSLRSRARLQLQLLQIGAIRQAAKPQQVADFFEVRMVGQFVDVDAAVGKHALIAIDEANAGIGSSNAFQPLAAVRRRRHEFLVRCCPP